MVPSGPSHELQAVAEAVVNVEASVSGKHVVRSYVHARVAKPFRKFGQRGRVWDHDARMRLARREEWVLDSQVKFEGACTN
jgi:hypothetical protein